jgi:RNA polymerase sigma factor (sigma-70 family)
MEVHASEGVGAGRVPGAPSEPSPTGTILSALLVAWQAEASEAVFERLVVLIVPQVTAVARAVLRRCGVHDHASLDDALSLVLDHLRRLPGPRPGERAVAPFVPRENGARCADAFLYWLAADRARDVARARRRHARHCRTVPRVEAVADVAADDGREVRGLEEARSLVRDAVAGLPPCERDVVTLLLEGRNQAVIAHVLGVCEGTVSRIRGRAILRLQALMVR